MYPSNSYDPLLVHGMNAPLLVSHRVVLIWLLGWLYFNAQGLIKYTIYKSDWPTVVLGIRHQTDGYLLYRCTHQVPECIDFVSHFCFTDPQNAVQQPFNTLFIVHLRSNSSSLHHNLPTIKSVNIRKYNNMQFYKCNAVTVCVLVLFYWSWNKNGSKLQVVEVCGNIDMSRNDVSCLKVKDQVISNFLR